MFKLLILQQLHNRFDDGIEYQVQDRLSFMRFLGLQLEDRVPDAKTVWLYRTADGKNPRKDRSGRAFCVKIGSDDDKF
jgi:IS5 family transposase